ncbi:Signal peptidase I [Lachnospiraceae bacterium TWA4]|nr:Signal peptidase I [Lachnospiraceae bacterium TWA4]
MKYALEFLKIFVIAAVLALIINNYLIVNAKVPTGSMESTVMTGDRIIANRLAYKFGEPQRGDIIIFMPPDGEKTPFLKRIIGLSGETIECKDSQVYINGNPLIEPYLNEATQMDFGPYTIPEDSYFMMGDNRNNSRDAREWKNKYITKDAMLGKAVFTYFPFSSIKILK